MARDGEDSAAKDQDVVQPSQQSSEGCVRTGRETGLRGTRGERGTAPVGRGEGNRRVTWHDGLVGPLGRMFENLGILEHSSPHVPGRDVLSGSRPRDQRCQRAVFHSFSKLLLLTKCRFPRSLTPRQSTLPTFFPLLSPYTHQDKDKANATISFDLMVHPLVGLTIEVYHGNCLAAILGLGYVSSRCHCFLRNP
jgi:hypothetical protein